MIEKLKANLVASNFKRTDDLIKALREFLNNEKFLLQRDLNERTLTHKLAEYLQKYFPDYNVDCEYNRMKKRKDYDTKKLNFEVKEIENTDIKQTTVYPDIIIHTRGNNENNYFVIEVKKKINNGSKDFDFQKLEAFTKQLNYKLGIYLEFDEEKISDFELFKNSKKLEKEND